MQLRFVFCTIAALATSISAQEAEIVVRARASGRTVGEVEEKVAAPLENAIAALAEVASTETLCARTGCSIRVRFRPGTTPADARRILGEKLRGAEVELCSGDAEERTIRVALPFGERTVIELTALAYAARERIAKIPGVESIEIEGARQERITVEVDDERLRALGLVRLDLAEALRESDAAEPEAIERIRLRNLVALRDVAVVRHEVSPARTCLRIDGVPALLLRVATRDAASRPEIERALDRELPEGARLIPRTPARLAFEVQAPVTLEEMSRALEVLDAAAAESKPVWRIARAGLSPDVAAGIEPDPSRGRLDLGFANAIAQVECDRLRAALFQKAPGSRIARVPYPSSALLIELRGVGIEVLAEKARELRDRLYALAFVESVRDTGLDTESRLSVGSDRDEMAAFGVSPQDFERTLALLLESEPIVRARGGRAIAIYLAPLAWDAIGRLAVRSSGGELIPILSVASLTTVIEPHVVLRLDRERIVRLEVGLRPDALRSEALEDIESLIAEVARPKGLRIEIRGAAK